MRVINALQRLIMFLLLLPVVAIGLDTLLRASNAQEGNPIVDAVRRAADFFILDAFRTVFPDQGYLQTALVALVAYGLLALLIVAVFRGLRSVVGSRPPTRRPPPAPAPPPPTRDAESEPPPPASDEDPQPTSG